MRLVRTLVTVTASVIVTMISVSAAPLHTSVARSTPAPASTVDGVVDQVVLEFLDPVGPDVEVEVVESSSGARVAGQSTPTLDRDGLVATAGFEPLTVAGTYIVTYRFRAVDGDAQPGSYTFRFANSSAGSSVEAEFARVPVGRVVAGLALLLGAVAIGVAVRRR